MRLLVVLLLALTLSAPALATDGSLVLGFGAREAGGDAGAGADESSGVLLVQLHLQPEGWPVELLAAYQAADDFNLCLLCEEEALNVEVNELSLGVGRRFEVGRFFRPWIGGGVARQDADLQLRRDGPDLRTSDDAYSLFAAAGARWTFGHFTTGLDARAAFGGSVRVEDVERDLDYWQGAWVVGVSW